MNPPALTALLRELEAQDENNPRDEQVRLAVRLRARDACEYCLMPTVSQFHIDHIIPSSLWSAYAGGRLLDHGVDSTRRGPNHLDNFAWACPFCNRAKGERVGRRVGSQVHRLFDPRQDRWDSHFAFLHRYLFILGISGIGKATEEVLTCNAARPHGPIGNRHDAILDGRYPPIWARDMLVP